MKKIPADFRPQHKGAGRIRRSARRPLIVVVMLVVAVAGLSACTEDGQSASQKRGEKQAQETFERQEKAVPYPGPQLRNSLERANAKERLLRTNDPKKIGYVYLLSFSKIIGYYTISGKVTGVGTQMKTTSDVERHGDSSGGNVVIDGPRDDGTYGSTGGMGIYFFTTEDVMVTTTLDYIWSDEVLPIDVPRLDS